MDSLHKLISYFREFPGIGPRQAERFAFFLLTKPDSYRKALADEIVHLKKNVHTCPSCHRFHSGAKPLCSICADPARDSSLLLIVAKDVDLNAIEKTKTFNGRYLVLGGTIPILDKEPEARIRIRELEERVKKDQGLKEIVFALSLNTESEYTREFIENKLRPVIKERGLAVSMLGRGLSTGTEIEYSDSETIKSALERRTRENI